MKRVLFSAVVGAMLLLAAFALLRVAGLGAERPRSVTASSDIPPVTVQTPGCSTFAVIGDYGEAGEPEAGVADLVTNWNPDFIITTGDNNYPRGEASTIDENIGQYYQAFIHPYTGAYGNGADTNRFFPSLGNHDWGTGNVDAYLDYFTLPHNERYYDFVWGPVHFFAVDSDPHEPDGRDAASAQAQWIAARLEASTAPWQLVYMHHPPYSSGRHGSSVDMQWPYKEWGADVVLAGHDHLYERLEVDHLTYIVNGLGGKGIYDFETPLEGSEVRYNDDYGAMKVQACDGSLMLRFITRNGEIIDTLILVKVAPSPQEMLYLPLLR